VGRGCPPGRRTATLQGCDLHKQCAVRELNPQPADSDYSPVPMCRLPWKPLRRNEIRDFSPPDVHGQLSLFVVKRCGEKCVCWRPPTRPQRGATGSAGLFVRRALRG
jgi:hypothetical protein